MISVYLTAYNSQHLCSTNTGLGNVLFQLSSQYSICKKYNIKSNYSLLYKFIEKLKTFNLMDYQLTIFRNFKLNNANLKHDIVIKEKKKAHIYDNNLIEQIVQNKDKNILITHSYLQSLKYYQDYTKEIQNLFSPDENSLSKIYLKYPQFLETKKYTTTNISIHLRFEWGANLTYNCNFVKDAINYLMASVSAEPDNKINIFVFSDNIKKTQSILSNLKQNFIYCENNPDYIDLWIMSLCDHNIICHSTLGWWGAFLNKNVNKIVIYPSDVLTFFIKKILRRDNIDLIKENIYLKEWVSLHSSSIKK